jgi:nucleoside-diphosphate-sugar epimerase
MARVRERGVDVEIVGIFNTSGPRLREGDARVVSNFIVQALTGRPSPSAATASRHAACATGATSPPGSWRCSMLGASPGR